MGEPIRVANDALVGLLQLERAAQCLGLLALLAYCPPRPSRLVATSITGSLCSYTTANSSCVLVMSEVTRWLVGFSETLPAGDIYSEWPQDFKAVKCSWRGRLLSPRGANKACGEHEPRPRHAYELRPYVCQFMFCDSHHRRAEQFCVPHLTLNDRYTTYVNCLSTLIMTQSVCLGGDLGGKAGRPGVTSSLGWRELQDGHERGISLALFQVFKREGQSVL